ncbi:MAG TPA: hypothetical protein PLC55_16445, partial [Zoogloea sp.]|nr:hypothetical protein [Zoogloea sp.]
MRSIDGVARREVAGIGRRDGAVHELDIRDERSSAPTGDNPAPFRRKSAMGRRRWGARKWSLQLKSRACERRIF